MNRRLEGRVAVLTGAATGIGRALASRLCEEGAALCLADIQGGALEETARALASRGASVSTHVVDVADEARVEGFAREVEERHGRADVLINNAGVALHGTVEEVSLADIEWVMSVNFWGTVYCVKHFLPLLKRETPSHIVCVSSIFGVIAPPGQAAYCASKFAVRGFAEALRHELERTNVKVSTVHPGGVRTGIARSARIGAGADPSKGERERDRFERLAITSPEQAAERIMRGMLRGEPRILVGRDASQIDLLQRLLPARYWRLLRPLVERRAGPGD
ncbi:MAG TPA: SDR family NAD(P)-dependent oxidoreductase [Pyrinomonadaceae bacterium]|nr:SDR family NAD(P)-dependent oxidoreductase [Pyrinomonadaceae bacterium]